MLTHGKFFGHPVSTHHSHFKSGYFQQEIPNSLEHVFQGWTIPIVFAPVLHVVSWFLTICWGLRFLSDVVFHNILYGCEVHLVSWEVEQWCHFEPNRQGVWIQFWSCKWKSSKITKQTYGTTKTSIRQPDIHVNGAPWDVNVFCTDMHKMPRTI